MILIYFLDQSGPFHSRAASRLATLLAAGDVMVISDLVRMECRIGPLRTGDSSALGVFDVFFARPDVRFVPLTAAVFNRAAEICAIHGFKTPDAIHLAAAIESGCDRFLTNDTRLSRFTGIAVEILP